MKRLLNFLILLTFSALCFAQAAGTAQAESDVQLYNEIKQSFRNGFYPGTVTAVDQLQSDFPESSFIHSALAYKGEALIYMEQFGEAEDALESAVSHMHSGSSEIVHCYYLFGRALYEQKKYSDSLEKFHTACKLALTNNDEVYYAPAVLYSGRAFYELGKLSEAAPHFEYVVSNGKLYEKAEYGEALQKLFICYNKCGKAEKTRALYKKLSEEDFEEQVYKMLSFYYGDACVALGLNDEAYTAYSRVLEGGENTPEVINKFLLRFAIDNFNSKDFDKAEKYLSDIDDSDENIEPDIKLVKNLYLAKILLERGEPDGAAAEAEKTLSSYESLAKKSEIEGAADSYYSTLLQCKIQSEKWDEVPGLYGKLKAPGKADRYAVSAYYYKKNQFEKVDPSCGELYASALCKSGRYEAACEEYEKLIKDAGVSAGRGAAGGQNADQGSSIPFDYALALFYCGRYEEAEKIAAASAGENASQKDYLRGLCLINTRNWKAAVERFAAYIRDRSSSSDFNKLALYYKGYAEYNLAQFRDSYSSFVRYCMEENAAESSSQSSSSQSPASVKKQVRYSSTAYLLRSYEYAVKSALQTGDFKNASVQASNLVRYSPAGQEQQKAVVLSAEIFTDYEKYDEAVQLLEPYTHERNDFAAQALFMTAKIYERQNKVGQADEYYRRVYEGFGKSAYADEAMYRCGEAYYSKGDYSSAYTRLNNYIYKYTSGNFSDAAMFYCADCSLRLGENERCVMLNKTLLQKYPKSVYAYGANKNMLEAYYRMENYSQALNVAREMLKDYSQQAADDEIGKRARELEKIVGGLDRRAVEKESEYIKLGQDTTPAGRSAGTELVKLYAESLSTQREAYELAVKLLARQTSSAESADAAFNAEFIAEYCRKNGDNKKAADMYLKAAKYYRSVKNEGGAAASLYGAAEAFAAEGLAGDAKETAALLKELYPQSIQAERVDRVTGAARN